MQALRHFDITPDIQIGTGLPLVLAGPCVAESLDICRQVAETASSVCSQLGLPYIFKASFDKANRTSLASFRGHGIEEGLAILARIKEEFGVALITDIHEPSQAAVAAEVVDVLQIPAFLCRQTDLLVAAAETGCPVNIKKGQFLAPEDMGPVVDKVVQSGNPKVMLTERGTTFGYHNLVVDFRSLVVMAELGVPVVFDATHSVQLPGGKGTASGGRREFVAPLVRAAAAVGVDALFLETHPRPAEALSDASNSVPTSGLSEILSVFKAVNETVRQG